MNLQLFQSQIVVIAQLPELAVQRSQRVIVRFHAAIIRERPELLSEELRLDETCHVWHTRLLEHSQQSLVFLACEPHAIAVCCRVSLDLWSLCLPKNLGFLPSFLLSVIYLFYLSG